MLCGDNSSPATSSTVKMEKKNFSSFPESSKWLSYLFLIGYDGSPKGSVVGAGGGWRADDVEPAFFALADAQHALMDGTSRVVTYGPDHNPHSPVTLANPITNLNYLSPISKRGKQFEMGNFYLMKTSSTRASSGNGTGCNSWANPGRQSSNSQLNDVNCHKENVVTKKLKKVFHKDNKIFRKWATDAVLMMAR
jgi:hypothetical protein